MHRGGGVEEELLAISPPPEFQDITAPPPAVFRDHSPCSSSSSAGKGHQQVWDFASRISFNILNEAMVIAIEKVLSQKHGGGCNSECAVGISSPTPFHNLFGTNSAESSEDEANNPSSITTSWEYLSKNISTPHHQRHLHKRTSPKHRADFIQDPLNPLNISSNGISRSASFHSETKYPKSINVEAAGQSSSKTRQDEKPLVQYRYGKRDKNGSAVRHSIDGSSQSIRLPLGENADDALFYNVPTQCDVYSLPIDSIPQPVIPPTKPIAAPRRARTNPSENNRDSRCSNRDLGTSDCSMEASRLYINSRKVGELESTSTKQVKRTIGHSILNLFKRKPRSKADNSIDSENSIHRLHEGTCCNPYATATTSRALPSPPPRPEPILDIEPEITVRISYSDVSSESSRFPNHVTMSWHDERLEEGNEVESPVEAKDFAASIEQVKDCGWYWGPLSSEAAEDLLRGEPDGSFIVRDSSDAHYIFSLTFKLNGLVRHVRIEHDQGNFSFGPLTRFKASTIVDFVEKAVAHSRSGRYLFFLHRRPILGPMRVQLLHPYSRFRHPRSLQHMCRFVILKYVRRDLISSLPLPKPLQEYLNTPHYYFEKHDDKKCS